MSVSETNQVFWLLNNPVSKSYIFVVFENTIARNREGGFVYSPRLFQSVSQKRHFEVL